MFVMQVGTKVAAVSRKTNTTTHEVLGIMTKGNTQIVCIIFLFFLKELFIRYIAALYFELLDGVLCLKSFIGILIFLINAHWEFLIFFAFVMEDKLSTFSNFCSFSNKLMQCLFSK